MQVEWEITLECNYKCHYCTNLDTSLKPELDETAIDNFIASLGIQYPGVEVFVFGGEPFIHPKIEYIIESFNRHQVPFVIQTNFSKKSVAVMKRISEPFKIQISIHPTEVRLDQLGDLFNTNANIRTIDVMYTGKEAIAYYFKVKDLVTECNVFLTPITDFGDGISNIALLEYNKLKRTPAYANLINFEEVIRLGKPRSEMWGDPDFSPKGKPCLYKDKYFLYSPNLDLYNCCYRIKTDGICPKDKCFLM